MIPGFDHTAPYIWAAYGLAALTLGGLITIVLVRARQARERLDRLQSIDEDDG